MTTTTTKLTDPTPFADAEPRLRAHFEENFARRGELGAAVSVWVGEREIVALGGGRAARGEEGAPFTVDTPVPFFSVTKGLAAACLLHVLAADGIPLATPVAALWPEFARAGKERVRLDQLLSHQAGLAALADPPVPITDHAAVAAALAAQAPWWPPGTAHGYHARTFGTLLDEVLRRRRPGQTLGGYWRETFAGPLGLDLWIGNLPPGAEARVATIYPARQSVPAGGGGSGAGPAAAAQDPFYRALGTPGSLTRQAFTNPAGLQAVNAINGPVARQTELPSLGGIGTARALGKFYAFLAQGGVWEGRAFFPAGALEAAARPLTPAGDDRVLCLPTAFSAGFMQDPVDPADPGLKRRALFGPSPRAFGQPGAGGSHAFADPTRPLGFAYVMNQLELGVLPNARSLGLVAALFG